MDGRASSGTIWYQAAVYGPSGRVLVSVQLMTISEKDDFSGAPDLDIFEGSRACVFLHKKDPWIRIELSPRSAQKHDRELKRKRIPEIFVRNLRPYGWRAKDFAEFPLKTTYMRAVFKEPAEMVYTAESRVLFPDPSNRIRPVEDPHPSRSSSAPSQDQEDTSEGCKECRITKKLLEKNMI
ncbi:putative M protein [Jeremy Point nyavirus]|uniref:M protein n=1 Tax=Jeremy Point nyavirus TaxID=2652327 RepID=A0AAE6NTQ2_9MONO|nr:putative M protein [Jeremy Point nyavirus]QFG01729.1 putative M protein [Jeremy Point nyavirus]